MKPKETTKKGPKKEKIGTASESIQQRSELSLANAQLTTGTLRVKFSLSRSIRSNQGGLKCVLVQPFFYMKNVTLGKLLNLHHRHHRRMIENKKKEKDLQVTSQCLRFFAVYF